MCYYSFKGGETVNLRFKELRKALGLTQEEFAEKIGLSRSYINLIEMGKKNPADRTIRDICRTFKVDYDWLVYGDGDEMFADDNGDAQAIVDSVMTGDNEFAKEILVKLSKLSEEHWQQLKEIFEELTKE